MTNNATWPIELGTTGVLGAGRWLWLRAILWAALLSAGALGFLFGTMDLRGWLNLPPNSSYVIFLVVPLLGFVTYAVIVRFAEARTPVEVLPSAGMLTELLTGATIGFITLCSTTAVLWSLGLYQVQRSNWRWSDALGSFLFDSYLSGMLEELLFRAIVLRILARAFGNRWGLVLSAVLSALRISVMYRGSPPWQSSSGAGSSLGCFTWQPGGFGCPLACTRHGTSSKISCSE
jgi:uncharacterized protein